MRDTNQRDDDDIDRAYRAAVAAAEDSAAVQRRRRAALRAIGSLDRADATDGEGPEHGHVDALADAQLDAPVTAEAGDRRAANEARWRLSATWGRGAVAACVMAFSVVVVTTLQDEPGTAMAPNERSASAPVPDTAGDAAPSATTGTTAPTAPTAPMMPAPATPAAAPARIAQAKPQVQAQRSAFPSVEGEIAGPGEQSERSARADAARADRSSGPRPLSPPVPAALPMPGDVQLQELGPRRSEEALPDARQARAAAESSPAEMAAAPVAPTAQAGGIAGSPSSTRSVASLARSALTAPRSGLLAAVRSGDMAAAQRILRTTDPDAERDADGRTALAIAVLRADVPLVELLLAHRANRLVPDRFGQTPQSYAEVSGDPALRKAFGQP